MSVVYSLDSQFAEKNQLGNKGANLVVMTQMRLPVPPGFVISIETYNNWVKMG
jgi:phosphoenolpyruvate synthase/pyruvate phosphate dikinase